MSETSPHTPESVLALAGSELARAVYRTANTLLANSGDAEEVTLDVLVALRKKLGELGEAALESWLPTLPGWLDHAAVSKAKGRARKRKHHSGTLGELRVLAEQLEATETRATAAAMMVREVLAYLPRRHRFVFVLESGLGHTPEAIAELTGLDVTTVVRTRETVVAKLREYGAHHAMPKAMIEGMAPGVEDNPLRHYIEVFGRPDAVTEERIKRRFEAWLRDDPGLELSAEDHSFHDHSFSGANFEVKAVIDDLAAEAEQEQAEQEQAEQEQAEAAAAEGESMILQERGVGGWALAAAALLVIGVLGAMQVHTSRQITALDERLDKLGSSGVGDNKGPLLLEPGVFVELAHGSKAEPSLDATIELLRNDEHGAEFRLTSGSIALHVKPGAKPGDVEWLVHDGRYDIVANSARFRVIHTSSVPEVEVFDGKVTVRGGLLGPKGVEVGASNYTLVSVIQARGDVPIAELMPYAALDPRELSTLAADEVYGRALALRVTDQVGAEKLLREIVDRGSEDWVSELAFEQLRTLVDPDERLPLQVAYAERFPGGQFAEPFAAIACQAAEDDEARVECWKEFELTYPNSLYGP